MTPAAPLEKARTILHRVYLQLGSQAPAEYNAAVEALLAALDADRGGAEAALREISKNYLLSPGVPGCDDIYSCKWCGGDDDHNVGCPTRIARRYFAAKGDDRG